MYYELTVFELLENTLMINNSQWCVGMPLWGLKLSPQRSFLVLILTKKKKHSMLCLHLKM